jgi:predicted PurR-regulated permease PerM
MTQKEKLFLIAAGLITAGCFAFIYRFAAIFLPLFIALILAYLLNPLVSALTARGVRRWLAVPMVFLAVGGLLALLVLLIVVSLKNELSAVQLNLPGYVDYLYGVIPAEVKRYLGIETPDKAYLQLNQALAGLKDVSLDLVRQTAALVSRAFASTLSLVLVLLGYVVTPVYLYYFLMDLPEMKSALAGLVPAQLTGPLEEKVSEIHEVLAAFVRGQLSVCAILAVLYSGGLFSIGIDLAIMIGVTAGLAFIIPYLGTVVGIALSVTMAFLKFHDFLHPLLCLGWFGLVQALEGSIITPKLVGDKVGLHPIVAMVALLVGGDLFGILGMLLAVPVAAILKVFFRSLQEYYRGSAWFRGYDVGSDR